MLTNNFYYLYADELLNTGRNMGNKTLVDTTNDNTNRFTSSSYSGLYPFYAPTGNMIPATNKQTDGYGDGCAGLLIGEGNTPPTVNDYKLEKQITSGFSCQLSYQKNGYEVVDAKKFMLILTITNTSKSDLVIKELGYIRSGQNNYYKNCNILLDRTVFDEPVTIVPGATKTFEYRLNIPQP
ncbi:MAG: hypothetical protein MSA76_08525 [Clostridium sp.]|nr:hypothetical protein [Clostridium sp.]